MDIYTHNNRFQFRAWDTISNSMYRPFNLSDIALTRILWRDDNHSKLDTLIIMQSTGIEDVSGNMIFEGDIVIPVKFKDVPNQVKYIYNAFYRCKMHGTKEYINILGNCQVKIIGNIYQNEAILN
jgi:uncharacterized phage protein (TIGR01671 family)